VQINRWVLSFQCEFRQPTFMEKIFWYQNMIGEWAVVLLFPHGSDGSGQKKRLQKVITIINPTDYGHPVRKSPSLKIHSNSQIFRYGRSMFCCPHRPKFSYFFDLCLHWVSVVLDKSHFSTNCDQIYLFQHSKYWISILSRKSF
jgi:hypothetical protein